MKFYVVAWEYGPADAIAGGGFDWYYDKTNADTAYAIEQENEKKYAGDNWRAFQLTITLTDEKSLTNSEITQKLDSMVQDKIDSLKADYLRT